MGIDHEQCQGIPRHINPKEVLEVTRLVTDGTKNACSFLYAAAARIGREMGYKRIQTYTLQTELGTSLHASGWICDGADFGGVAWTYTDAISRNPAHPVEMRQRWSKILNK